MIRQHFLRSLLVLLAMSFSPAFLVAQESNDSAPAADAVSTLSNAIACEAFETTRPAIQEESVRSLQIRFGVGGGGDPRECERTGAAHASLVGVRSALNTFATPASGGDFFVPAPRPNPEMDALVGSLSVHMSNTDPRSAWPPRDRPRQRNRPASPGLADSNHLLDGMLSEYCNCTSLFELDEQIHQRTGSPVYMRFEAEDKNNSDVMSSRIRLRVRTLRENFQSETEIDMTELLQDIRRNRSLPSGYQQTFGPIQSGPNKFIEIRCRASRMTLA